MLLYGHVLVELKTFLLTKIAVFTRYFLHLRFFDGGTALGTPMRNSFEDARDPFVRFLTEEREDIEREFTAAHGAQRAVVHLWKEISSSELCPIPSGVTFD